MTDPSDAHRASQIAAVMAAAAAAAAAANQHHPLHAAYIDNIHQTSTPMISRSHTANVQHELMHSIGSMDTPSLPVHDMNAVAAATVSSSDGSESDLSDSSSSASSYTPSPAIRKQGNTTADASAARPRRTSRVHNPLLKFNWDDFADDDEELQLDSILDQTNAHSTQTKALQQTHSAKEEYDEDDYDEEDDEEYQHSEPNRSHHSPSSKSSEQMARKRGKYRPRVNPGPELTSLLEQISSGARAASQAELARIQVLQRRLERLQHKENSQKSKEERKTLREEQRKNKLETANPTTSVHRKRKSVDESPPPAAVVIVPTSPPKASRGPGRPKKIPRIVSPPPPEVEQEVEMQVETLVESTDEEVEQEFANELLNVTEIPVDLSDEEGGSHSYRLGSTHLSPEFELLRAHTKLVEKSLWHLKVLQIPDTRVTQYAARVVENEEHRPNSASTSAALSSTNSSTNKHTGHPAPAFVKECFYPPRLKQLPTFTILSALLDTAEKVFDNEHVASLSDMRDSTPSAWTILSHD